MTLISRDPDKAAGQEYDLIIIGGGIYGCMLSLESSRRGLRSLLIEQNDFGQHTSFNSLRIIHGGFRYLQSLDFKRMRESVRERHFFLKNFPDLVKPLPCLMPLYGEGLRRPTVLRLGNLIYNALFYDRNDGLPKEQQISSGKILDINETVSIFPSVDTNGLKGSVRWYDGLASDSHRLLIEILRVSSYFNASCLNYMEAKKLLSADGKVIGIKAYDWRNRKSYNYKSNVVINAGGPWCREIAAGFDQDIVKLFRSTMAWNLLLNKKNISDHALAVSPNRPGAHTYFLVPWKGRIFAGTGHAPWLDKEKFPVVTQDQIRSFLDDLNDAVEDLNLTINDVMKVFPGLQSATEEGGITLAPREIIINHASRQGPIGLYSVSGVKFTTARLVAEKTLNRVYPNRKIENDISSALSLAFNERKNKRKIIEIDELLEDNASEIKEKLSAIIKEESVMHLDDLVFRRTNLWLGLLKYPQLTETICKFLPWNEESRKMEINRLNLNFQKKYL